MKKRMYITFPRSVCMFIHFYLCEHIVRKSVWQSTCVSLLHISFKIISAGCTRPLFFHVWSLGIIRCTQHIFIFNILFPSLFSISTFFFLYMVSTDCKKKCWNLHSKKNTTVSDNFSKKKQYIYSYFCESENLWPTSLGKV